ncbi:hypothetical protein [Pseudomonas kurunegalensis]|uniref:hypothetical protein n=1 Tax=Pseudomonas kurunegalensis TaxID=485880 RepID=UPI002118ADB6|nr:hypothetical protein [Pseudomonas kurunegalensis]
MDNNKMRDLKALAEAAHADLPDWQPGFGLTDPQKDFSMQAGPAVVLSLLAEIERLQGFVLRRREKEVEYDDALCKVANQRDQLKAENEDYKSGQERYEQIIEDLKAENEALRKDAARWAFFKDLSCQIQAFPHSWGQMTPEKMDFMCDDAMAKETNHG